MCLAFFFSLSLPKTPEREQIKLAPFRASKTRKLRARAPNKICIFIAPVIPRNL